MTFWISLGKTDYTLIKRKFEIHRAKLTPCSYQTTFWISLGKINYLLTSKENWDSWRKIDSTLISNDFLNLLVRNWLPLKIKGKLRFIGQNWLLVHINWHFILIWQNWSPLEIKGKLIFMGENWLLVHINWLYESH